MISVITCINDEEVYEKMLLKSLKETNKFLKEKNLKELEIVQVFGKDYISLAHAYNSAQKNATFSIKAFIHEDLDLLEPDWIIKLLKIFEDQEIGLVGLLATTKINHNSFFWFEGVEEYIYGKAFIYNEKLWLEGKDPDTWNISLLRVLMVF